MSQKGGEGHSRQEEQCVQRLRGWTQCRKDRVKGTHLCYAGLQQPEPESKGKPGARVKQQGTGSDLHTAKSSLAAMGRRD